MPTTVEVLAIPSFDDANIVEELELSANASDAQAVVSVLNPAGLLANDYLVLSPSVEVAELRQILSISTNNITFSANLGMDHRIGEKAIKLFGNQIRVYRAANVDGTPPADASFTLLGTVAIDADQDLTNYTDSAGGSGYWYKFTYYNSTSAAETDLSMADAIRGGEYGHYVSLQAIKNAAGLKDSGVSNEDIALKRDDAESEIDGVCAAANYTMPLQTSAGVEYTPGVVKAIALQLAAGLLMIDKYETESDSYKEGNDKMKDARGQLKKVGKGELILLDSTRQSLAYGRKVDGWPDETTADAGVDGVTPEPARVTMSKKW